MLFIVILFLTGTFCTFIQVGILYDFCGFPQVVKVLSIEGIRVLFPYDICPAVDIRINEGAVCRAVKPAVDPLAGEGILLTVSLFVSRDRVTVKDAYL